jgi:hypothetical protein
LATVRESFNMTDQLQVFVIGSPRSGTSITYYAMREVFDLPGRGESHVIPVFQRVIHTFFRYAQDFAGSGVLAGELSWTLAIFV